MRPVKHVVLLKFKPETTVERIDNLFADLGDLQNLIPGLRDFVGGPYSSPEGINQGYTHGFVMTFSDAPSRDAYLTHPEHERVKRGILPNVNGVIAFDFEA